MPTHRAFSRVAAFVLAMAVLPAAAADSKASKEQIARGKYMLIVGSCNDCHTAGFAPKDGNVPESEWLLGDGQLGFRGPWGTTYAPNLRRTAQNLTEDQWVTLLRTRNERPPMPWINLRSMHESDLRAIYRYLRMLGPAGEAMPAAEPPGSPLPSPPYFLLELGADTH